MNPKPELDDVLALMSETGALGVVNTHSGTYLGLLYGEDRDDLNSLLSTVARRFPGKEVRWFGSVSCREAGGNGRADG